MEHYVDDKYCIACCYCANEMPEVFEICEGKAKIHDQQGATEEEIIAMMGLCPVSCIKEK
jgi:ferredoxin